MRQLRNGFWQCYSQLPYMYSATTAIGAYWLWLRNQRYVAVKTVGNTDFIEAFDIHERRMARGSLAGD